MLLEPHFNGERVIWQAVEGVLPRVPSGIWEKSFCHPQEPAFQEFPHLSQSPVPTAQGEREGRSHCFMATPGLLSTVGVGQAGSSGALRVNGPGSSILGSEEFRILRERKEQTRSSWESLYFFKIEVCE